MRGPNPTLLAILLVAAVPNAGWACPWTPPTDPCVPSPAETGAEGEEVHNPNELMLQETVEIVEAEEVVELEEEEPEPECGEIRRQIEDRDRGQLQRTLEEILDGALDIEDCAEAVDALHRVLMEERDDFLVYLGLQALDDQLEESDELVPFLEHRSRDVRRKAAELLAGEDFEPEAAARVTAALLREEDPSMQVALAALWPEGHETRVSALLRKLIEGGGPSAVAAMREWTSGNASVEPILAAMKTKGPLHAYAMELLASRTAEEEVRDAFLEILEDGPTQERIHAAASLALDPTAAGAAAWESLVLDSMIPLPTRAALVLSASYFETWRPVACHAKRSDPALSALLDGLLADPAALPRAMILPPLSSTPFEAMDAGTVRGGDGASVRCASRPAGAPRPGVPRIPAGTRVFAPDRFTMSGVEWRGIGDFLSYASGETCWVRGDTLDSSDRRPVEVEGVLEADVPVEMLDSLERAIAAGDLELFDPIEGFTGIRLRNATPDMQVRWQGGEKGQRAVLAEVEARAAAVTPQNR